MDTKTLVSALTPTISKSRISELLEGSLNELSKVNDLLQSMNAGSESNTIGKGKFIAQLEAPLRAASAPKYRGKPLTYMAMTVAAVVEDRINLTNALLNNVKTDVLKEALDYERVLLIQYIGAIRHVAEYTRALLSVETAAAANLAYSVADKGYVAYVNNPDNRKGFAVALSALAQGTKNLAGTLEKLRGVSYSPDREELNASMNPDTKNPMQLGFLPEAINIPLWFGRMYNAAIVWWYDRNQLLHEKIVEQIHFHELSKAGASAEELKEIQKKIDYYNDQLKKIEARLKDIERDAGL